MNSMKIFRTISLVLLIAACGPSDDLSSVARKMTAIESGRPFTIPAQTLTAHTGEPFDLRAGTTGRFALLFFGYTYCPDICPIQVATANAAVERLSEEEQARVVQLFVTMDPQRDSPERLSEWLGAVQSPAIGLRGSTTELEKLLGEMGFVMPPMSSRQLLPGGTAEDYLVPHPTSLFLITPDGLGRFQYPHERATPTEIAEDLRRLMKLDWPNASIVVASISITNARIPESPTGERLAVYAEIENRGKDDTLVSIRAGIADEGSLHQMEMSEGMMTMRPTPSLDLPAGTTLSLRTGGAHGMLEGLREVPEAGDLVDVTFVFESGTEVLVSVPVVSLADLVNGA